MIIIWLLETSDGGGVARDERQVDIAAPQGTREVGERGQQESGSAIIFICIDRWFGLDTARNFWMSQMQAR